MSSTVTSTSISGKTLTKANQATSMARLPAWSSPNFFHTATGKASQACFCWYSSTARRAFFAMFIARKTYPGSAHPSAESRSRCRRPPWHYGACATDRCYKLSATSSGRRQPCPVPWGPWVRPGADALPPEPGAEDAGAVEGAGGGEDGAPAAPDGGADAVAGAGELAGTGASCRQAAMITRLPAGSALPPTPLTSTK